jgi:hypothetical protein
MNTIGLIISYIWKNKIHVPNHQADQFLPFGFHQIFFSDQIRPQGDRRLSFLKTRLEIWFLTTSRLVEYITGLYLWLLTSSKDSADY